MFRHALVTPDGRIHTVRVLALVAGLVLLIAATAAVLLVFAASMDPSVAIWGVLLLTLVVKLPLLGLVWWVLGRRQPAVGPAGWSDDERREALASLRAEAERCRALPDAATRLADLQDEALHVADTAPEEQKAGAVALMLSISEMRVALSHLGAHATSVPGEHVPA